MEKQKKYFWVLMDVLLIVVIVAAVFVGVPMLLSLRASWPPARTITVTGEGMTTATPDLAEITFSVVSQGANPQVLSTNNTQKMNAVLQFVSSQGISASDTATTGYDLEPDYNYDQNTSRQYITGYTLTQTVTVKIHDLTQVASVLGGLAPLGVNQIGGVDFTFNDMQAALAPARDNAISQAQAKAMDMASQAGASLGSVVNISENNSPILPETLYAAAPGVAMAGGGASNPNVQPGTQNLTDDVTITYALQ